MQKMALALAALVGLGACDALMQPSEPTHRYVIELDAMGAGAGDAAVMQEQLAATEAVISRRIEIAGGRVHAYTRQTGGRMVLETSGIESAAFAELVGVAAQLAIRPVDESADFLDLESGIAPPGSEVLQSRDGSGPVAVKRIGGINGRHIIFAAAGLDPMTNDPVINISLDEEGGRRFAQLSSQNIGKRFAIVIDDEVVSAPIIREPILGGALQISGGFPYEEAEQLAIMLQAGALPVPVKFLEVEVIE